MPKITMQTQAVLLALLREPTEKQYGLEIGRAARLSGGTLYPILARLEEAKWVESEWEQIDPTVEGRRPRRYYRLTGVGERIANEHVRRTFQTILPALRPQSSGSGLS